MGEQGAVQGLELMTLFLPLKGGEARDASGSSKGFYHPKETNMDTFLLLSWQSQGEKSVVPIFDLNQW